MSSIILGGIIGLLLGLAWCYWQQIQAAYRNRDTISAASNLYGDVQQLGQSIGLKI